MSLARPETPSFIGAQDMQDKADALDSNPNGGLNGERKINGHEHIDEIDNTQGGVLFITAGGPISQIKTGVSGDLDSYQKKVNGPQYTRVKVREELSVIGRYIEDEIRPGFVFNERVVDLGDGARENRQMIMDLVSKSEERVVIITAERGFAYTLAQSLDRAHQRKNFLDGKIVIVTTSHASFNGYTDARFNIGFAIGAAAKMKELGCVALADRGWLFDPQNVLVERDSLDRERFIFEEEDPDEENRFNNLGDSMFVITGGTIDGVPNFPKDGYIQMRAETVVPKFLRAMRLKFNNSVHNICMKDSREILPVHRERIHQIVRGANAEAFFVTHGTYTMPSSARYVLSEMSEGNGGKQVSFLGSMVPLEGYDRTDADFNLGFAAGAASQFEYTNDNFGPRNVAVAMNAQRIDARFAFKNEEVGMFESSDEPIVDVFESLEGRNDDYTGDEVEVMSVNVVDLSLAPA